MSKLISTNVSTLVKALSNQFPSHQTVRNLLISLLALSTRSDVQLVWLAKLCGMQPNTVLANPDVLLQCNTKQLLVLVDHPEFCDTQQLNEFAEQLNIDNWQSDEADALKRTQVKSACVLNDSRLLLASVWDPFLCPTELLPWLAWSVSVDEWDEAWSEALKRQVINDAFAVHQVKGTPYALQKALDSLNIKTEIKEWWQGDNLEELPRGTVQVWALLNRNLDEQQQGMLTPQMLKRVRRIIEAVKRGSIHVDVQLGLAYEERLCTFGVSSAPMVRRYDAPQGSGVKPPSFEQNDGVIGTAKAYQTSYFTPAGKGVVPPELSQNQGYSGVSSVHQSSYFAPLGEGVKPPPGRAIARCAGVGISNHNHHLTITGLGVLPSDCTGTEYVLSATRQTVFQHFNIQGAA